MAETIAKQKSVQRGRRTPQSKNGSGGRIATSRSQAPGGPATDILALSAAILAAPRLEALALKDSLAVRNIISEAIAFAKLLLPENLPGSAIDLEEDGRLGRRQAERRRNTPDSLSSTRERRKYTRYSCIGIVEFRALDSDVSMSGQLIDPWGLLCQDSAAIPPGNSPRRSPTVGTSPSSHRRSSRGSSTGDWYAN